MKKTKFGMQGNICSERIKIGRSLQNPPLSRQALADKIQDMGLKLMTKDMIARIENNQRHLCDAEMLAIAKALNTTMAWLAGDMEIEDIFKKDLT